MTNNLRRISYLFLLLTFILGSSNNIFGQESYNGIWKAKISEKDSQKIHISFYRETVDRSYDKDEKKQSKRTHKHNFQGSSFVINDFQGLSLDQINSSNSNVNFSLVREAGTIQMVGKFNNGKGSGKWNFLPDPNFISALNNLGFEKIPDEKIFASALLNVRTQTVSELRNAGLTDLDFEDIFKATIFKINANYISEMSAAGFANLDMEDLVQAKIFKIDANYARDILAQGFGEQSIEKLVQFKIFKITPEFLNQMKAEGLTDLNPENLVQLRIFKIDGDFIQKARAKGYTNPTVGELVEMKIHGKLN